MSLAWLDGQHRLVVLDQVQAHKDSTHEGAVVHARHARAPFLGPNAVHIEPGRLHAALLRVQLRDVHNVL